ncbi:serine proteinase stubble-like [Metopolophium dirhodum]|uniref:serine proteinase stubble-like n=1 Tax=Metopolophium dirhodum TaxID=44670 RepID=UPI00298FA6C1|nr:serine proteinase stubble-like [Metopolophium dirhodum]
MSNRENSKSNLDLDSITHNPPVVDGLTLIPSWFTLPVETHISNNASGPPSDENKKSIDVHPLTTMLTTTDSIEIKNDSYNMSNRENSKSNLDLDSMTNNPPVVDGLTLIPSWFTLPVETHILSNNTSGPPSEENITDIDNLSTTISTLDSVEASKNVLIVAASDVEENSSYTYPSENILTTTTDSTDTEYVSFNMSNYKDVCGRQLIPMSRIVGGDKVSFGEWPWQISLRHKNSYKHKCGAVLFNENWAITTAHCVRNVSMNDIHLVLGKNDFAVKDEPYGFLIRKLQTVIIHPKYNTYAMGHDLALLRFDEPVIFQPNILPVCIPEDDLNFAGFSAHITGWGALYYGGLSTIALQGATVSVLNNSVCENMFRAAGYIKKIPDTFICAGSKDGGYDACKGDSGGPMVVQRPDNRWVVAGIIAWGMRCGEPNSPGVYMRISKFKDWINKIILQS